LGCSPEALGGNAAGPASGRSVHRIKPAGVEGMTAKKPTQGKIQTTDSPVQGKSLYGIL